VLVVPHHRPRDRRLPGEAIMSPDTPRRAVKEHCPHCGGNVFSIRSATGPHFGRLECGDCHRRLGWLKTPWTLARARAFTMPFGKHRGWTIGELIATPDGKRYMSWVARYLTGNV
jgi:hypothetical protein